MTRLRALAIPALVALCMVGLETRAPPDLSNRADLVSGDDALVQVRVPVSQP